MNFQEIEEDPVLHEVEEDIRKIDNNAEDKIKSINNILKCFVIYRPDIGYLKGVMPNLIKILVLNIKSEFK